MTPSGPSRSEGEVIVGRSPTYVASLRTKLLLGNLCFLASQKTGRFYIGSTCNVRAHNR